MDEDFLDEFGLGEGEGGDLEPRLESLVPDVATLVPVVIEEAAPEGVVDIAPIDLPPIAPPEIAVIEEPRLPPPELPAEQVAEVEGRRPFVSFRPTGPQIATTQEADTMDQFLGAAPGIDDLSESFVHKRLLGAAAGFLTGGPGGAIVGALTEGAGVFDLFGGGGGQPAQIQADPCPGGVRIAGTNRCFETPFTPQQQGGGTSVVVRQDVVPGMFGELSVNPTLVQTVRLKCPPGLVLGRDERCYAVGKGGISNKQRKWPKGPRPIMSAQDAKVLRRAETVRNRAKAAAMSAGFSCKKR